MALVRKPNSPFWYKNFEINGRQFSRSTKEKSKREAERIGRDIEAEVRRQVEAGRHRREGLTMDQACGKYWLEKGQTLGWARDVQWHLVRIVKQFGTTVLIGDVTNADINQLVQSRRADGAGAAGINRTLAVLRQVMRRASRSWDQPVRSINWSDHRHDEPKGRNRWIDEAKAAELLATLPLHIALAVEWSFYTGCRLSETRRLKQADVDLRQRTARIQGKTGPRVLVLSTHALGVLSRALEAETGQAVFNLTNRRRAFETACKTCGIEDFTWHDLRHCHATWLRQRTAKLDTVQRSLGHSMITTTGRYAHVMDSELIDALEALPDLSGGTRVVTPFRSKKHSS